MDFNSIYNNKYNHTHFSLKICNQNFANEEVISQRPWNVIYRRKNKKKNVNKVTYQNQNTVATATAISLKKKKKQHLFYKIKR